MSDLLDRIKALDASLNDLRKTYYKAQRTHDRTKSVEVKTLMYALNEQRLKLVKEFETEQCFKYYAANPPKRY